MAHTIEAAKTNRASCKTCKAKIEKGELRLGEEAPNPFNDGEMGYRWHHLKCGAKKKSEVLMEALDLVDIEIPEKAELLKLMETADKVEKPTRSPYADYAKTARSSCIECKAKIEKGDLRVSVYIEPEEMGGFGRKGFAHPACSPKTFKGSAEEMMTEIKNNSTGLNDADYEKLEKLMES